MYYLVDKEIYSKGRKMPPRRVPVEIISNDNGTTRCRDKDGDTYTILSSEVFSDGLEGNMRDEVSYIEHLVEGIWVSEDREGVNLFLRDKDGSFTEVKHLQRSAEEIAALREDPEALNRFLHEVQ